MRALVFMVMLATVGTAHADDPTPGSDEPDSAAELPSSADAARELHARGAAELDDARFAQARDLFEQAMELVPNPGSAYNLALAYRGTGESLAAIALFERLLSGEFGAVDEARAADMRRWIRDEQGALATVELTLEGPPSALLRVDGEPRGTLLALEPMRLRLDAGRHSFSARADGYVTAEDVVYAARASEERLVLRLPEVAVESRSVFQKPAFWIVAAAIVVAAAAAAVVIALGPYEADPQRNEPFGMATALTMSDF